MLNLLKLPLAVGVMSTMTACGMFQPKAPDVDRPYSGFMSDYQPLNSVEVEEREFIASKAWIAPGANLRSYKTMIVDPIKLDATIQQNLQVTRDTMDAIRAYMTEALTHKLEEYYQVSEQASGRTLRAKVAITGLETRDEPLRFYEYWPTAMAFTGMTKLIGIRDEDILLFVEAEFVDADSRAVVAKTMVGMVGHERLENEWEAVSLNKLTTSIDQWIEQQVVSLKQVSDKNYIVSHSPVDEELITAE
ncbi:DUF3313 domain-containing protein [Alkalimarinus alittae]|uniref:DUF3313 domain-containing protein n=1 Tax=Alkalimarinus alittae TaxID=2961619 RepID=A0ABY6N007_9ALTE|nr:DUF3313 domain-containing protein [Alkalimarinus alittae]UZE95357.1 DUF3313 domain-containing protein [Alkalimarinus alittae]